MGTNQQLVKWCKDINKQTGDWSKLTPEEHDNAVSACTCILSAQTYADSLGCAAARINACYNGEIDKDCQLINGKPNPACPCTALVDDGKPETINPAIAEQRRQYKQAKKQYNWDKEKYERAASLYNAIQHAPWGVNQNGGYGIITYTNMQRSPQQRFCGGANRTGKYGHDKYIPSAGIKLGPVNYAIDIPWYFDKGSLEDVCFLPQSGFYLVDAEVFDNGGLTRLEDWDWPNNFGFNKTPVLYEDYIVVKWTGDVKDYCSTCTYGELKKDQARTGNYDQQGKALCANTCYVNAQIVFIKSIEEMCGNPLWSGPGGSPKFPDDYSPRWPGAAENPDDAATRCATSFAPSVKKFECCVNTANIGKDVSGDISIHQKCELKNDLDPTKENCASFPGLPGCSSPGGGDCSDTDPCVTGACVNDKCRCGPDRIGKRCEKCNVSYFNCNVVPGAKLNEKTCKCECGPGYWGIGDQLCFKYDTPWYGKIRDWFRLLWISLMKDTKRNKILLLAGVGLLLISLILLSIMIPSMI